LRNKAAFADKGSRYQHEVRVVNSFLRVSGLRNPLLNLLVDLANATDDPVFSDAANALKYYGCGDPKKHAGKRIKQLLTLLQNNGSIPSCVDAELKRQKRRGEKKSVKAACRAVAGRCAFGPTFDATVKRVERIYRVHKRDGLPSGDTGRELFVAQLEDGKIDDCCWVSDDRYTRQALARHEVVLLGVNLSEGEKRYRRRDSGGVEKTHGMQDNILNIASRDIEGWIVYAGVCRAQRPLSPTTASRRQTSAPAMARLAP
jgi:hypothetical protein